MATTEGEATLPATATAATTSEHAAERGVGGKLKRQTGRRHQTTPYTRPIQNQVQRRPWISRIVDPAYRIISGGATRLLPYFFSNTASPPAITAPIDQNQQHQDELDDPQETNPSITPSFYKPEPALIEKGGTSNTANANETISNISAQKAGTISELEKIMGGKTFSQEETDRLIEILNSRAIDLPDVTRDEKVEVSLKEEAKKSISFLDKRKEPISGKDASSELWATPTPLAKSSIFNGGKQVRGEAGLSPAELAKAYMGGQASSSNSQGFVARSETNGLSGGILAARSAVASPSSKPSACWPGVKLDDQYGFATPRSQRENFGLQNFPRTPYSRTLLSSSKSQMMQLQDNSSKRLSTLQSPSQSAQTRYGQLKLSKGRDVGIFGPNRRSRQSATMSPYSRPVSSTSRFENSAILKLSEAAGESSNLFRSQTTTTYDKHKGSEVATPTVPTHSSETARTILAHLERTLPTPKNKSAELKLATSWRHQPSKTVEQSSSNINNAIKDSSAKLNEDIWNVFSHNPPSSVPKPTTATTDNTQTAMASTASASNGIFRGTDATNSSGTTLPYELEKPKTSLSGSTHEKDVARSVSNSFGGEPANIPKPPSHPLGNNKPTLSSISVTKPFQRWAVPSSGSNAGFTFPVSSSDGASGSEPTTPSIMPFTSIPSAPKDEEIPQFTFDGNRGDKERLVFVLPSASEEAVEDGDVDDERLGTKFTFGSENSERISFSSCC